MIYGGYILQPRKIQESDISIAPPYIREIWNYLLREANSKENPYKGYLIKRGQTFRSYNDIQEGTKWYIGWRKMTYNENHMKKGMRFLRETGRITTKKERGGVLITICKYDYYQEPENYERTTKAPKDRNIAETQVNHCGTTYNKNNKNNKKEEEEKMMSLDLFEKFWELYPKHPDKGKAKTAWDKICTRKHSKVKELPTWNTIKKAIILQKKSERWQTVAFIPHPTTWLNQSRWLDDPKEMVDIKFAESGGHKPKFKWFQEIKYTLDETDDVYKSPGGDPY